MPIRALIVDDEPLARTGVRQLVEPLDNVTIVGEATDGDEAVRQIKAQEPALVFLDVQMPEMSGLEVVREVGVEAMPLTIFVTAYDQYALEAFEAHALDYLLKPIEEARFQEAMERARQQLRQTEADTLNQQLRGMLREYADEETSIERFTVRSRDRIYFVDAEDVQWIESEGDYVALHDGDDAHLVRKTMKKLEEQLDADRFLRVHRSYIVNVEHIDELRPLDHGTYQLRMASGTPLKTSRGYSDNIDALLDATG
ncbi:LytR/AlgR family response regulator transcription factor [Salinibacter altiplanensis]|uniref:LytR/AlgR family response regulator transcription factor n=1 Tax=Salinibacter altiplanensis TaxID=1803181 RepID=UPI000C9EDC1A|nr:LytTR family DNA-binding domain-containing protein [Salinibacter altiplanensis]